MALDGGEDYGLRVSAKFLRAGRERWVNHAEFFEPTFISNEHFPALNSAPNAAPGDRFKALSRAELQPSLARRGNNGSSQWMLTSLLQARNQPDQFVFLLSCCRNYCHEFRFAFGQRAGLVDNERVYFFH